MSKAIKSTNFRQIDITRALRAAKLNGLEVKSFEIDPITGKMTFDIVMNQGADAESPNEWDTVLTP